MFGRTLVLLSALSMFSACKSTQDAARAPSEPGAQPLGIEVFTAPAAAGAVNSTIVLGASEAVVIDAQFTKSGANAVADRIDAAGRTLTQVFITHGHPDHYFGARTLLERFPQARVVASAETVEVIRASAAARVEAQQGQLGDEFPGEPVIPEVVAGSSLQLEGHTLELMPGLQGDTHGITGVVIRDANTVVLADVLFSGVHVWTADSTAPSRAAWTEQIDALATLEGVTRFVPGHQSPQADQSVEALWWTKTYLAAFDEAAAGSEGSEAIISEMSTAYPDVGGAFFLQLGAKVAAGEVQWQ